jgi:hypothetical protein
VEDFKARWRLAALAALMVGGVGQSAQAATRTTSLSVTATVVATCSMAPTPITGQTAPATCRSQAGGAPAITAPPPVVKLTRDPKTGELVRTIEF